MEISKRELIDLVQRAYKDGYYNGVLRSPGEQIPYLKSDMKAGWLGSVAIHCAKRVLKGASK